MKYFIRILLAIVGIVFILSLFDNKVTTTETKNEPQTVINDSRTYSQSWRMPRGTEYTEIGKLIVQNNIKICGEYHVKEVTSGEYLIACSPDGINWQYFVAFTKIDKFYRASDEMVSKLTPPR
jgi:hypothetical protein